MNRLVSTVIVLFAGVALAIPPRKVISAVRVDKGPVVDGDLSDEVWRKAECRSDFEDALSQPKPFSEGRSDLGLAAGILLTSTIVPIGHFTMAGLEELFCSSRSTRVLDYHTKKLKKLINE